MIIVSSFREEARGQKQVVGVQHDLAVLFAEASQNIAGAPSNAHLADLFRAAAPRKMKTNVWARLRGQQEQLTIQASLVAGVQHARLEECDVWKLGHDGGRVWACMTKSGQIAHFGCASCSWQAHAGLDSRKKHVLVCATGEAEAGH